jgi:hypothetical protein
MHAYRQDAGALPLVLDRAGDHKLIGKDRQDRVFSNSFQLCLERPIDYHRQIAIVAAPQGTRSFAAPSDPLQVRLLLMEHTVAPPHTLPPERTGMSCACVEESPVESPCTSNSS